LGKEKKGERKTTHQRAGGRKNNSAHGVSKERKGMLRKVSERSGGRDARNENVAKPPYGKTSWQKAKEEGNQALAWNFVEINDQVGKKLGKKNKMVVYQKGKGSR